MRNLIEVEDKLVEGIEQQEPRKYLSLVTKDCCPRNKYLYHTTTSVNKLASILESKNVRTGEFSTWPISVGDLSIVFKKANLFEKGVRPVWWWSEEAPEGFVSYDAQYSQPEECAWVTGKSAKHFNLDPLNFEKEDIEAIMILGSPEIRPQQARQVRKMLKDMDLDIPVKTPLNFKRCNEGKH